MQRLFGLILALGVTLGGLFYAYGSELGKEPEKYQDRIEIITAWKMMEALNLDNATAEKVLEIRRRFVAKRKELQKSMNDDFAKLKELLKESGTGVEEKELAATLANIRAKRAQLKDLWLEHYDEVSKVLTVRQQAELVLFFKDFRKELHGLIRQPQAPQRPANPSDGPRTGTPSPPHSRSANEPGGPPGPSRGWSLDD
jgi:hypothetical protein